MIPLADGAAPFYDSVILLFRFAIILTCASHFRYINYKSIPARARPSHYQ
jgi:hypothetical protein